LQARFLAVDSFFVSVNCKASKCIWQALVEDTGTAYLFCCMRFTYTLAMLNIEPPEPKNSGSNADDPINSFHLLGMLHIVDLIC
jgi:hypothetical protein